MLNFNQTFQETRNRRFEKASNRVVYVRQYSQRKNLACLRTKHFSICKNRKLLVRLSLIAHCLIQFEIRFQNTNSRVDRNYYHERFFKSTNFQTNHLTKDDYQTTKQRFQFKQC